RPKAIGRGFALRLSKDESMVLKSMMLASPRSAAITAFASCGLPIATLAVSRHLPSSIRSWGKVTGFFSLSIERRARSSKKGVIGNEKDKTKKSRRNNGSQGRTDNPLAKIPRRIRLPGNGRIPVINDHSDLDEILPAHPSWFSRTTAFQSRSLRASSAAGSRVLRIFQTSLSPYSPYLNLIDDVVGARWEESELR